MNQLSESTVPFVLVEFLLQQYFISREEPTSKQRHYERLAATSQLVTFLAPLATRICRPSPLKSFEQQLKPFYGNNVKEEYSEFFTRAKIWKKATGSNILAQIIPERQVQAKNEILGYISQEKILLLLEVSNRKESKDNKREETLTKKLRRPQESCAPKKLKRKLWRPQVVFKKLGGVKETSKKKAKSKNP
ncbi:14242_t:CDS:2 [Ambispora leptoticha]|uniref:14242_t:CDS:1 n=1 Tax=Ambispora leptoticha TaxID=144679 RepID=A0A9N9B3S6_9GLOM|nr:14242_t:CDS:2 [Ambispora leptoticha]